MAIRVFDMFCGVSAFRTAAEKVGGFEFVGYCDNDQTAIAAYRTLYDTKGEYFCDDARKINTDEMPDFDLLVGGFPCVAFSQAGQRRGFADERGTLFFELARILQAKHPAFFCFENVPAILSFDDSKVFETILGTISELGYNAEWQCIDGSAYVPQSRKRVFIVGYFGAKCAGEVFPILREGKTSVSEITNHANQGQRIYDGRGAAITQTAQGGGFAGKCGAYFVDMNEYSQITDTARCITARQDSGISHRKGEHSGVLVEYQNGVYPMLNPDRETVRQNGPRVRPDGSPAFCLTVVDRHGVIHNGWVRRLTPRESFRLMGFGDEQYDKLREELHLSDSKLYKLAGNSIIVPILKVIFTKIKELDKKYHITKGQS